MVFARFADDLLQIPQIARIPAEPLFADGDRIFARLPLEVRKRFEKQPVAFVDRIEHLDQSSRIGSCPFETRHHIRGVRETSEKHRLLGPQ